MHPLSCLHRPAEETHGDGGHTEQRALDCTSNGSGIGDIVGKVLPAIDARSYEIGRLVPQEKANPHDYAVGGRALHCVVAFARSRMRKGSAKVSECEAPLLSVSGATIQTSSDRWRSSRAHRAQELQFHHRWSAEYAWAGLPLDARARRLVPRTKASTRDHFRF